MAQWEVAIDDLTIGKAITDSCDILIYACGYLNAWVWPDIPGLDVFKGELMHSARWNDDVDITGKSVGLIGNG